MTRQEYVVLADHAALGFEQGANTPGFPAACPSKTSSLTVASNRSTLADSFAGSAHFSTPVYSS